MKILCVIDCLGPGGSQRQLSEMALGFKAKGHDVSFLTYYSIDGFYIPLLEKNGISVHIVDGDSMLQKFIRIRRFIRDGSYRAVISFLEGPDFICEIAGLPSRKWKLLVGERSANPKIIRSLRKILLKWFHFFSDYVVSNSSQNVRLIRTVNPILHKARFRVIYNIVDLDYWKPDPDYLPLTGGKLRLVVAASHQFLKNLNGLIEALSILDKDQIGRLEVSWYGDRLTEPYYSDSLPLAMEKIDRLGLGSSIKFFPATNELRDRFREADAIGLFSFYEGLPNSICEGMACGKTIVCSAVSDIPCLLSHQKDLLFDPQNPTEIAGSLSRLISMDKSELYSIGSANRLIAEKMFNRENILEEYLNLMQ